MKLIPFVVLLAACVGVPPPAPHPIPEGIIATEFERLVEPRALGATLVDSAPLPAAELADSELSVTVRGHFGAVQTRDRSWVVQVGPNTQVVAYRSSSGPAGAVLNLSGKNATDPLTRQLSLPQSVVAGDALVVVSGSGLASPSVDEAMAVVFVPYAVSADLLRPPALGNSWLSRYFRTVGPVRESALDMDRCPGIIDIGSVYKPTGPIDPAGWAAAPPTVNGLLASMGKFMGDYVDGWPVAAYAPSKQHKGYGTFVSGEISTALCVVLSTLPKEDRRRLALALVQRGLDEVGAFCDERVLYPLGGHCQGRKALVIFTGHVLHVESFANPTPIVGPVFQEDYGYPNRVWWFNPAWRVGWAMMREAPWDGRMLSSPPSTWGDRNAPNHDTWNWLFGYYGQVVPSQVGSALAMTLLGREKEMGNMVQAVRDFMSGPPPQAQQELVAAGHPIPWGSDYGGPAGFCSTAWKLFAR